MRTAGRICLDTPREGIALLCMRTVLKTALIAGRMANFHKSRLTKWGLTLCLAFTPIHAGYLHPCSIRILYCYGHVAERSDVLLVATAVCFFWGGLFALTSLAGMRRVHGRPEAKTRVASHGSSQFRRGSPLC